MSGETRTWIGHTLLHVIFADVSEFSVPCLNFEACFTLDARCDQSELETHVWTGTCSARVQVWRVDEKLPGCLEQS